MMFQARSHTFELKNAGAVELHVGWTIDTEGKEDPFTVLPQAGTLTLTLAPTLTLALTLTLTPTLTPTLTLALALSLTLTLPTDH